jgi:predicted transcriptional regulator
VEPRNAGVSDAELGVLKALWERGPATVRDLRAHLGTQGRQWAYTTVQTLLQRLEAKGCVSCERGGGGPHVFAAAVSREQLVGRHLRDLADRLCDGTTSPLLLALVEGGRLSAGEIARLRRLLDEVGPAAE